TTDDKKGKRAREMAGTTVTLREEEEENAIVVADKKNKETREMSGTTITLKDEEDRNNKLEKEIIEEDSAIKRKEKELKEQQDRLEQQEQELVVEPEKLEEKEKERQLEGSTPTGAVKEREQQQQQREPIEINDEEELEMTTTTGEKKEVTDRDVFEQQGERFESKRIGKAIVNCIDVLITENRRERVKEWVDFMLQYNKDSKLALPQKHLGIPKVYEDELMQAIVDEWEVDDDTVERHFDNITSLLEAGVEIESLGGHIADLHTLRDDPASGAWQLLTLGHKNWEKNLRSLTSMFSAEIYEDDLDKIAANALLLPDVTTSDVTIGSAWMRDTGLIQPIWSSMKEEVRLEQMIKQCNGL
ncbi:MAG TPA: hypothetical protein V6C97_01145, partial [Oculatellaceae cyanobacterium]